MKISLKLTLAFMIVSLVVIGMVGGFLWMRSSYEFNRYLDDQRKNEFIVSAISYYQANQTWSGLDSYLREQGLLPPKTEVNPPPQPYVLIAPDRTVLIGSEPYHVGEKVKKGEIEKGIPIEFQEEVVGTVISTGQPLVRKPVDQKYFNQITQSLWLAALGGLLVALILGSFLARTITRPIREITDATRVVSQGRLDQQVPVRSADELGELARSFNRMSSELARLNTSRRQMTADIAHDLRNPLTVIGGYLESLEDGTLQVTNDRLRTMQTEVKQLMRLVEDLRTLSLAEGREMALNLQPVHPGELLRSTAQAYQLQAEEGQIQIQLEIQPGLPKITLDPERIEQVMGNLVTNALRYTPAGGKITLGAFSSSEAISIIVQDTGSGISQEDIPIIFDRFYRGEPSRYGNETGLGLSIAKSIIELHGGNILVESTIGQGSKFTLIFPRG